MKYIVVVGDPVDGFEFCGPFDTHRDAREYAEGFVGTWWVAPLKPKEEE